MYRDLKSKYRQNVSDIEYQELFGNFLTTLFEYDERIYRPSVMEDLLHDLGICALIKTDTSNYTPVICNLAGGERYADGLFKNAICYDAIGREYVFTDWQNNPEICVIFNTGLLTRDSWIDKNSSILTDIDISLQTNIVFSRLKPLPIARDSKTKNIIDESLNDIQVGKIKTILSEMTFRDLADEKKMIDVLDLTDVTKSQYIQYLLHAYDSIFSRTCMLMGLDTMDNGKQAQITVDEMSRHDDVSLLMPLVWYKARKQAFDKAGLKFDFSDILKSRFIKNEVTDINDTKDTKDTKEDTKDTKEDTKDTNNTKEVNGNDSD